MAARCMLLLSSASALSLPAAAPVVAASLLPEKALDDAPALRSWTAEFLTKLPDANYNVLVYVTAFFKALLEEENGLTPARLSAVLRATVLPLTPATHHMDAVLQYLLTSPAL